MSDIQNTLERVTVETLERHAFMFAESRPTAPVDVAWRAHLNFDGWSKGSITIRCTQGFSALMCDELLGFEGGSADDDLTRDVLLEFVNVLAGRLLSEISPDGRSVKLDSPRLLDAEFATPDVERHSVAFDVDGQAGEVVLELHNAPA
jgi:CheY-specific phosphatase CheX